MTDNQFPAVARRGDPLPGPLRNWTSRQLSTTIAILALTDLTAQGLLYTLSSTPYAAVGGAALLSLLVGHTVARAAGGYLGEVFTVPRVGATTNVLAALTAVASVIPTSALASLSFRFRPPDDTWLTERLVQLPHSAPDILVAVLAVAVVAPLVEELVFRGLLHRVLRRRLAFGQAAFLSGLAFGLAHGEPWFLMGLLPLGILLAWIYETTGSLLTCAVTHGIYNLVSFAFLMAVRNSTAAPDTTPPWSWVAACTVVLIWLLIRLKHSVDPVGS